MTLQITLQQMTLQKGHYNKWKYLKWHFIERQYIKGCYITSFYICWDGILSNGICWYGILFNHIIKWHLSNDILSNDVSSKSLCLIHNPRKSFTTFRPGCKKAFLSSNFSIKSKKACFVNIFTTVIIFTNICGVFTVFTTHHFLCNLRMAPIGKSVCPWQALT